MAISARKITAFQKLVANLADNPPGTMTVPSLKQYFDSSPEELRVALDGLIDDLASTTLGSSGTENVGSPAITGIAGNTVYAQLLGLKTLLDSHKNAATIDHPAGSVGLVALAQEVKDNLMTLASLNQTYQRKISVDIRDFPRLAPEVEDGARIQRAIEYAKTNNYGEVKGTPLETYICKVGITIYCDKVSLISEGATLDFSGLLAGNAVTFDAVNIDGNQSPQFNILHHLKGFRILGNYIAGVTGLNFNSANLGGASNFSIDDCAVDAFDITLNLFSNSYASKFNNCSFRGTNCIKTANGGTNYGEKQTFTNCIFYNSGTILDSDNQNGDLMFVNCSFDYCNCIFKVTGGRIYATSCHFESNTDADYWFNVAGDGCLINISHSELLNTGNRINFEIGTVNDNVIFGGISITDCMLNMFNYTKDSLILGKCYVRNINRFQFSYKNPISDYLNKLSDGHFALGNISEWTLSGASIPTYDSTTGHTTNGCLKLKSVADGQDCYASKNFPILPGQSALISMYVKAQGIAGGQHLYIGSNYLDSMGNVIAGAGGTLDINIDYPVFSYTDLALHTPAPKGAVNLALSFNTGLTIASASRWIDDIVVNII